MPTTTPSSSRLIRLWLSAVLLCGLSTKQSHAQTKYDTEESVVIRQLKAAHPTAPPEELAERTPIGADHKDLIRWMHADLLEYLNRFEEVFAAKLRRIERYESMKTQDLATRLAPWREQLTKNPHDPEVLAEIERISDLHRVQGFATEYQNAEEYESRFVGRRKLRLTPPSASERALMNRPGSKRLYVDTWAVPFFDTGFQTQAEARAGVAEAVARFDALNLNGVISLKQFLGLVALFARPEFDDLRRYKLEMFPAKDGRFANERSDARFAADFFPDEFPVVTNAVLDLDPLSYRFGLRTHIVGLTSHLTESQADGRIFTGPADFLEHDFAHLFFNLATAIPGLPAEWTAVHEEFAERLTHDTDLRLRRMKRLIYFHFTHESGYKILLQENPPADLRGELALIRELLATPHYYELILPPKRYPDGYEAYLQAAFPEVDAFFTSHLQRIHAAHCASALERLKP